MSLVKYKFLGGCPSPANGLGAAETSHSAKKYGGEAPADSADGENGQSGLI